LLTVNGLLPSFRTKLLSAYTSAPLPAAKEPEPLIVVWVPKLVELFPMILFLSPPIIVETSPWIRFSFPHKIVDLFPPLIRFPSPPAIKLIGAVTLFPDPPMIVDSPMLPLIAFPCPPMREKLVLEEATLVTVFAWLSLVTKEPLIFKVPVVAPTSTCVGTTREPSLIGLGTAKIMVGIFCTA
jgi:hypothetical protein